MQAELSHKGAARRYAIGVFDDRPRADAFCAVLIEGGKERKEVGVFEAGEADPQGPFTPLSPGRRSHGDIQTALEGWLLPMHARFLADAIEAGRVLVWARIESLEEECGVCLCMLKHSGRTVQIHDFNERDSGSHKERS